MIKKQHIKTLGIAILGVISIVLVVNQVIVDNHWYDTRWGGDTGENVYPLPTPVTPPPPEEEPSGSICGGVILSLSILSIAVVMQNRRKYV